MVGRRHYSSFQAHNSLWGGFYTLSLDHVLAPRWWALVPLSWFLTATRWEDTDELAEIHPSCSPSSISNELCLYSLCINQVSWNLECIFHRKDVLSGEQVARQTVIQTLFSLLHNRSAIHMKSIFKILLLWDVDIPTPDWAVSADNGLRITHTLLPSGVTHCSLNIKNEK